MPNKLNTSALIVIELNDHKPSLESIPGSLSFLKNPYPFFCKKHSHCLLISTELFGPKVRS